MYIYDVPIYIYMFDSNLYSDMQNICHKWIFGSKIAAQIMDIVREVSPQ